MSVILLIIYTISLGLYFPLNRRPSIYYFPSIIDRNVPLIPASVWIYSSYYLLHPLAIIAVWHKNPDSPLLVVLIISTLVSSLIWWIFPNGVKRPKINSVKTLHQKLLSYIYTKDSDSNGFPSGHISHTIICCYFLMLSYPSLFLPIYLWCVAICISTLTTKQHYFIDYIFTVPLTLFLISLVQYLD